MRTLWLLIRNRNPMAEFSPESLPNRFDFAAAQPRLYAEWESRGYFHAEPPARQPTSRKPFTIVIPPPNVTGALHLGHALNNTLQDILIRLQRMQGFNALWMPGTDHAGIATQAVVERRLLRGREEDPPRPRPRGARRAHLGVEGRSTKPRILGQLKQMGC